MKVSSINSLCDIIKARVDWDVSAVLNTVSGCRILQASERLSVLSEVAV